MTRSAIMLPDIVAPTGSLPPPARGRALKPAVVQSIRDVAVAGGKTLTQIAQDFGLNQSVVSRRLAAARVELRERDVRCACRRPLGHRGGCHHLFIGLTGADRATALAEHSREYQLHRRRSRSRRVPPSVTSDMQARARDALFAEIADRVPRWLDPALRDDIISDAYLEMMESAAI